jgi:hypothetical protein
VSCPCESCEREGAHDAWCSVHHADYEALDVPPCDCGLREGTTKWPEWKPVKVHCYREDDDE